MQEERKLAELRTSQYKNYTIYDSTLLQKSALVQMRTNPPKFGIVNKVSERSRKSCYSVAGRWTVGKGRATAGLAGPATGAGGYLRGSDPTERKMRTFLLRRELF